MTQVLGAFIVILGVVLAVLGTISTFHQSRWFGRAVFLVAALIVGVQSWQTIAAYVEEQRIRSRVTEAIRFTTRIQDARRPQARHERETGRVCRRD